MPQDFTIIPAPNPDGYVYTWDYDRLWYKNRSPIKGVEDCFGFDLNRNWVGYDPYLSPVFPNLSRQPFHDRAISGRMTLPPAHLGIQALSHSLHPRQFPYRLISHARQTSRFSLTCAAMARCVRASCLIRYWKRLDWPTSCFLSLVMHPFSYSCDTIPGDVEDLIEGSLGAAKALKGVHGTAITVGSLCERLYRYILQLALTY
jgi:hypothetical protein